MLKDATLFSIEKKSLKIYYQLIDNSLLINI